MKLASLLLCALSLTARCSATRVAVNESQELPLRKAAVLGTVFGRLLSGSAVAGLTEQAVGKASDPAGSSEDAYDRAIGKASETAGSSEDAYDRVQALLQDAFGVGRASENSFRKLLDSLRVSKIAGDEFVHTLEARLTSPQAKRFKVQDSSQLMDGSDFLRSRLFGLPPRQGSRGVMIIQYPSHEQRTLQEVKALLEILSNTDMSNLGDNFSLRYFAQSHTPEELSADPGAEVLIMFEPPMGTLRQVMSELKCSYKVRMRLIFDVFGIVLRLKILELAHISDISPDTLLVVGDASDLGSLVVVLDPDLLVYDLDSTFSAADAFQSDYRQFGTVLRFMLSGDWPRGMHQHYVDVFLAYGRAIEAGAFTAREGAAEFDDLVQLANSPEATQQKLVAKRMQYLRLVVEAEMDAKDQN